MQLLKSGVKIFAKKKLKGLKILQKNHILFGVFKKRDLLEVIVDTTVQEKNISYPTDEKLINKARKNLVKEVRRKVASSVYFVDFKKEFFMIVAGNWKMKMGFQQALQFLSRFNKLVDKKRELEKFIFFPPASLSLLFQKESFYWGGQNVHHQAEGAWTGETSAKTLKEMGASFCLLGHSERRYTFGESDVEIEKKFSLLQKQALIPVLCVGESLPDRFDKKNFLSRQVSWLKNHKKYQGASPCPANKLAPAFKNIPFIVAYEPVWSIGTGDTASAQEVDETAQFIKEELSLPQLKIFYGGSLDSKTVKRFTACAFIDGFLLGGASLDPDQFYNIYQQTRKD